MGKKSKKVVGEQVSAQTGARLERALEAVASGRPAAEAASEFLEASPEEALGLAAALGRSESPPAAELARALADSFPGRQGRRAFKRSLYLLGQRGLRPAERAEEPVLKGPEPPRLPTYVSLPDPAGHQMVIAAVPGRGGYDACLCSVSPQGVEHFMLVQVPRKGIKELVAKVEADSKLPIVETTPAHARYLLEEAQAASQARGRALEPEFTPFLKALASFTESLERPPVYGLLDEAEVGADPALLERSPRLLEDIGLLWVLPAEEVRPYVLRLEEAETSGLVLSREQRQERLLDIFGRAARELFDAERRRAWRRRLEESAWVLARRGRADEARVALAAAIDFGHEVGELRPNPLALALVSRSLAPGLARAREAAAETDSLIIKPGGDTRGPE